MTLASELHKLRLGTLHGVHRDARRLGLAMIGYPSRQGLFRGSEFAGALRCGLACGFDQTRGLSFMLRARDKRGQAIGKATAAALQCSPGQLFRQKKALSDFPHGIGLIIR